MNIKAKILISVSFAIVLAASWIHISRSPTVEVMTSTDKLIQQRSSAVKGSKEVKSIEQNIVSALASASATISSKSEPLDREYLGKIDEFLNADTSRDFVQDGLKIGKSIASNLHQKLASIGLNRAKQALVLKALGAHYYHQSIIGERDGMNRTTKIKLIELSIAHLEEGRTI